MILNWSAAAATAVLAHRGGASLGPANSLVVLDAAVQAGAHAVEIDVQELRDGSLVLFHDRTVRTRSRRVHLADLDLAQFARASRTPPILIAELLARVEQLGLGLYLDLKVLSPTGLATVLDLLAASPVGERTLVGSFDTNLVSAVVADGRLRASVLYRERTVDPLELAARLGCTVVHPCFDEHPWMVGQLAGRWMERVHDAGLAVVGWNSNDPAVLAEMAAAGFDVICTDDPRRAPAGSSGRRRAPRCHAS